MKYFISKQQYNGSVDCPNISGYNVAPKYWLKYDGIKVKKMVIIKPDFIKKIIKRKVKNKLNLYLNYLIDDSSDDSTRRALGDIQRYRLFVNKRYVEFLEPKYMTLLNNKIDILERNIKTKIFSSITMQNDICEEMENHRTR